MQQRPEEFKPVEQKQTGTNWMPYALGGGVAVALLCAVGFVVFAIFFFRPEQPQVPIEPTPTLGIVSFATSTPGGPANADGQSVAEQPAEQVTDPQPEETQPEQSVENTEQPTEATQAETPTEAQPAETAISQPAPPNPDPYSMTSPDYGIHAFLFWRPEVAERDLGLIEDAGFRWVKQEFAWREIEGAEKGHFNWENSDRLMSQIESRNLKVLARVGVQPEWAGGGYPEIGPPNNYQDFGDFLFELATRYKGKIGAYQIWNEPNLSREWGERPPSPEEYTQLLKVAYEAVKRADPNAQVITAGLAPTTRNDDVAMPDIYFVQGLYDAGAQPYFDMLGAHGAGYKAPPEMDPADIARDPNFANPGDFEAGVPEELRRIYGFRHVEDLREIMVRNGDADKRVAVLEFGWTTDHRPNSPYKWHRVDENIQGEYIVRAYQYAKENWQPWIGVMSVIYMPDVNWTNEDEQFYWSILVPKFPDTWPRPAYYAIQNMPK